MIISVNVLAEDLRESGEENTEHQIHGLEEVLHMFIERYINKDQQIVEL